MANEKWNLQTNTADMSQPGTAVGLVNAPLTATAIVSARGGSYGQYFQAPAPLWYTDSNNNPVPGGRVTPISIQLFWKSNVGMIPAGSLMPPFPPQSGGDPNDMGSLGLNSLGISGHNLYINGATSPSVTIHGPKLDAVISYYLNGSGVRTAITPSTTYTFVVEPIDATGTATGNKSATLTVTTPATTTTSQQVTIAPNPPGSLTLAAPLPIITSGSGSPIQLTWPQSSNATGYEVWDNNTYGDDLAMDPSRPGLMVGDVLLIASGSITMPTGDAWVTATTPNYTTPGETLRLKVRAVRTDGNGTAYSSFSPVLQLKIPPALYAPNAPAAPTVTTTPISGNLLTLTLTPPTVDSTHGPAQYYVVKDSVTGKSVTVWGPLGSAPNASLQYSAGQSYSITVAAGNTLGISAASTALTGTMAVPTAPTGVALNGSVTTTTVPIQWTPVSGATGYNIYDGTTFKLGVPGGSSSNATVTGYSHLGAYDIIVYAVNAYGTSAGSTPLTGTTS